MGVTVAGNGPESKGRRLSVHGLSQGTCPDGVRPIGWAVQAVIASFILSVQAMVTNFLFYRARDRNSALSRNEKRGARGKRVALESRRESRWGESERIGKGQRGRGREEGRAGGRARARTCSCMQFV